MHSANQPQKASITTESSWLSVLQSLSGRLRNDDRWATLTLCGAECAPLMAAWEVVTKSGDVAALNGALEELTAWAKTGGAFTSFRSEQPRAKTLLRAIVLSIQAALSGRQGQQEFDQASVRSAIKAFQEAGYGNEAVASPERWLSIAYPKNRTKFDAFCHAAQGCKTAAVGIVWDVICQLCDFRFRQPVGTATIKILLFGQNELGSNGAIAELRIEVFDDTSEAFIPDVRNMGLTVAKTDLLGAMQDAWRVAGLKNRSGRWRITPCRGFLQIPWISGNSAQAATVCALWAAAQQVPGGGNDFQPPFALEPGATISACVKSGEGPTAELGTVDGIPQKLEATRLRSDLVDRTIVASEQDEAHYKKHRDKWPGDPTLVRTVGEAFSSLFRVQGVLTQYRQAVIKQWEDRWEPGTAALGESPS